MDKYAIIKLKKEGYSNRKIATMLSMNRKTIARYWNEYNAQLNLLETADETNIPIIQEQICTEPVYNITNRKARKYTAELDTFINSILEQEELKAKKLRTKKQQLTQLQIHELAIEAGYDIGRSTISNKVREKRNQHKECFIKQHYEFGDRFEYDFGQVNLLIDGQQGIYYIAVISAPASNFRWAYLYKNQQQDVFMDSHVRFFQMLNGIPKEMVYDNMRNVVTKFIGHHEKELNKNLLNLSLYYGFDINVTNCFSGNEKGHVEGSVKFIRNKIFAKHYTFKTFEDAKQYLQSSLVLLNEKSEIKEEQLHLLETKPPLELATCIYAKVNKYSFIRVENNFYSVPEYLVYKDLSVKIYYDKLQIYHECVFICEHKKIDGMNEIAIDINHYLDTFLKKPGALHNSLALKSIPSLKSIYDQYFSKEPRKFIELLHKNKGKDLVALLDEINNYIIGPDNIIKFRHIKGANELGSHTRHQISKYNALRIGGKS